MRKILGVALLIALLGLLAPAGAGQKSKRVRRTETISYALPAIGSADATGLCPPTDCIRITPGPKEAWLAVEITDASGMVPAATIGQDQNTSDNFVDRIADICGKTAAPVSVTPGVEVVIWVWAAPSFVIVPCQGAGTSGEVTITLSNRP